MALPGSTALPGSMSVAAAETWAAAAESGEWVKAEVGSDEVEDMDTSEPDWAWFYLAECGQWHMFGSDPFAAVTVNSNSIEQSYMRNRQGCLEFHTHKYSYRIDFKDMKQTNLDTGKQRPVKRALQTVASFRSICDTPAVPVPSHWEAVNSTEPYQLIALMQESLEFRKVKELYERTMSNTIRSIHRIQNTDLWEFFCRKREQLRRIKKGAPVQERMLFHGTSFCNVSAICMFNFDWRLAGSNGAVYGKGSYFARDARYSSKFCEPSPGHLQSLQAHGLASASPSLSLSSSPHRCMFLARVLVGDYTMGSSKLCRPPSKDGTLTNVYDSCVDDAIQPKIFVVFDSNQVYPEYLIEFH